jgi:membrane protease YdiL (CAAX protease family)
VAANPKAWEMNYATAAVVWAAIVILAAVLGTSRGYGGPRFAVALGIGAALFAFELFLAAPTVLQKVRDWLGGHGSILATLVPLFAVLIYSFVVAGNLKWTLAGAAYAVVPSLLCATSVGKPAGTWLDYLAAVLVWLPVEFRWMYRLFPYPPPLTHTLTILMALATGVAAFVLVRRLDGIGYAFRWARGFGWIVIMNLAAFGVIAVPLGIRMGFLTYGPSPARLHSLPVSALGIFFFTAWPEEFLFRGLLQNLFSRTLRNQWAGLALASVIFGLSHIFHAPYPNWKYVILATIAGFFYGRAWMKSGSMFPSTVVHALVDISWHVLFR